ncbi:MAG: hypothetical protein QXU93_11690 [Thermoproteus sp.]
MSNTADRKPLRRGRDTNDPFARAVERLRREFPDKPYSWIRRALLRLPYVRETSNGTYIVEGRREFGDWKPFYYVWWSERDRRWYCSCYFSTFGAKRKREICTHVAAVILYRKWGAYSGRKVYLAKLEVSCRDLKVETAEKAVVPLSKTLNERPRYVVYAVSDTPKVKIVCDGREVAATGVETDYSIAKAVIDLNS